MPIFTSLDPNLEISGGMVYAVLHNLYADDLLPLLQQHGFDDVQVDAWYSVQALLNFLSDVHHNPDSTVNLVAIGAAACDLHLQTFPQQLYNLPLEEILSLEELAFAQYYRNGDFGYTHYRKVDDRHFVAESRSPWPDDLNYGFVYALIRAFRPSGMPFAIVRDEDTTGPCHGGELQRLHIYLDV